jgi:sulfoxide reductase heme-binding subunit YedZ
MNPRLKNLLGRLMFHAVALTPAALLVIDYQLDRLTANPIQEITFRTGKFALLFLLGALACTPLNTLLGWRWTQPLRRTLGLYAFFYALLHFLTFVYLDYGLDPELLQEAIFKKPYALVGFSAFLILLPLALTSTKGWQKRLGKRWKKLHQLTYVAILLVIVHFLWLVKADHTEPLAFGVLAVGLLLMRLPRIRQSVARWRTARAAAGKARKVAAAPAAAASMSPAPSKGPISEPMVE